MMQHCMERWHFVVKDCHSNEMQKVAAYICDGCSLTNKQIQKHANKYTKKKELGSPTTTTVK